MVTKVNNTVSYLKGAKRLGFLSFPSFIEIWLAYNIVFVLDVYHDDMICLYKSDIVKDREAWHATVCGLGVWHNWVTKQQL